jgi:hypothetical protein
MRMQTWLISLLVSLVVSAQVALAQPPIPPPPQGSHRPTTQAEKDALATATELAKRIADRRGGKAKKAHDAWKKAAEDGRVVIIESYFGNLRAWTWPDNPGKPPGVTGAGMAGTTGGGKYTAGQSSHQFAGITAELLFFGCPCSVACAILHEGYRLEQTGPETTQGATQGEQMSIVSDQQEMWSEDVANINDVMANEWCCIDVWCCVDLLMMKSIAQAGVRAANVLAQHLGMPVVPIPQ